MDTNRQLPVVVLCGGRATRFGGAEKHLLRVASNRVIDLAVSPFRQLASSWVFATTPAHTHLVHYLNQVTLPGTKQIVYDSQEGGGVCLAVQSAVASLDVDRLVLIHGDEVAIGLDAEAMLDSHDRTGAAVTLACTRKEPAVRDFFVEASPDGLVNNIYRHAGPAGSCFGIGAFICERSALNQVGSFRTWPDQLAHWTQQRQLRCLVSDCLFFNINRQEDIRALQRHLARPSGASQQADAGDEPRGDATGESAQ